METFGAPKFVENLLDMVTTYVNMITTDNFGVSIKSGDLEKVLAGFSKPETFEEWKERIMR